MDKKMFGLSTGREEDKHVFLRFNVYLLKFFPSILWPIDSVARLSVLRNNSWTELCKIFVRLRT